jgi:hypothetical protein
MFFVSLHSRGGSAVLETPFANGPRHWGQNRSASGSTASSKDDSSAAPATAASPAVRILICGMVFSFGATMMGHPGAPVNPQPEELTQPTSQHPNLFNSDPEHGRRSLNALIE